MGDSPSKMGDPSPCKPPPKPPTPPPGTPPPKPPPGHPGDNNEMIVAASVVRIGVAYYYQSNGED